MYNFAVEGVQLDRHECSPLAALLFNVSVLTVQFETVWVFNQGAIFMSECLKPPPTPLVTLLVGEPLSLPIPRNALFGIE